jgi:hypothetical protein
MTEKMAGTVARPADKTAGGNKSRPYKKGNSNIVKEKA